MKRLSSQFVPRVSCAVRDDRDVRRERALEALALFGGNVTTRPAACASKCRSPRSAVWLLL